MKVLFIAEINSLNMVDGSLHIAIPMLAAVLKKYGHKVSVVSNEYARVKHKMSELKPDVVGYSVYTGEHKEVLSFNRRLKKDFSGFITIMGGPHPTYFPEIINEEGVDAICIGDGFEGLPEFLRMIENGLSGVPLKNIWWKNNSNIVNNETGYVLDDINTIPMVDYEIYEEYIGKEWPVLSYMTGFGCPYKCSYCFNPVYNRMKRGGFKIRRKQPKAVVEELAYLRDKYKIKYIVFLDDIFTVDALWLKEFSAFYSSKVNLPFSCITRLELVDDVKLDYLNQANCYVINYGIESGNDYIRNKILNRNQEREMMVEKSNLIRKKNIKTYSFNILNIPGETIENAFETFSLNVECKPTYAEAFQLVPFPRTAIYEYAVSLGYFEGGVDDLPVTLKKNVEVKNKDRAIICNFQKLFSIAVRYPRLLFIIKLLIRLPLGGLYELIRKLYKGYVRKKELMPYRIGIVLGTKVFFSYFRSNKP